MSNFKNIIEESFSQYSAAVIQSRALVDARDFLKPSARQIFYSMLSRKLTHKYGYKKTANAVGMAMADYYIHGDSSCEGIIMRAGQHFALRYPLVEVKGNAGSLIETGNWAAMRYTESRLGPIATTLFKDIDKETISDWRDNYDNTKQYPSVLPSKGFYNIVNGTGGIAVGMGSSIPQFNIKDVNHALEVLLLNPNCTFEEIYCVPDFATGGYLINEEEVKNALKYGSKAMAKENDEKGASCKLRSKWEYDKKENCIIVTEIPYSVYTNTICKQLEDIINNDEINPGIDRFNDLTGENPNIKIYLKKDIVPEIAMRALFRLTSLQYHYSINMTMLDEGRFPKVFTWKEALQAHINHEKIVYRRGFEFDLKKIKDRIHILDGLLICMASIDEVVKTIKSSSSTAEASKNLQANFKLDEEQAKAVLDMKLSRLAHLEVEKLKNEKTELEIESARIEKILNDTNLFNQELINEWRAISAKYGDEHRTKVIVVNEPKEEKEIIDVKPEDVVVITTKSGLIKRVPLDNFKVQKRGGKGVKSEDDVLMSIIKTNTIDTMMFFTSNGKMYRTLVDNIPVGTNTTRGSLISDLVKLDKGERVVAVSSLHRKSTPKYIIFITKNGMIKKSYLEEYTKTNRNNGISALKVKEGDEVCDILFQDEEDLILVTELGMAIRFKTDDIAAVGRTAMGVKGMKLNDGDTIVKSMSVHKETDTLAIICSNGLGKKIELSELPVQGRNGKGVIVYKPENEDYIAGCALVSDDDNLLLSGSTNSICISIKDVPLTGRTAAGNILFKNRVKSIAKL